MMLHIFIFSLIIAISDASVPDFDFCVADTTQPATPSGYPCKSPTKVTVDDFVYSGLGIPGNTATMIKSKSTPAFDDKFPALNGMGISMSRLDMAVGGVGLIHVHPHATEVMFIIEGTVTAGFISTTNVVYYKNINHGEAIVFPQGLTHFLMNSGNSTVFGLGSFSASNPGLNIIDDALFRSSLPSHFIEKVALLDEAQVKKLKGLFGGAN